jgi:hypothetical protein
VKSFQFIAPFIAFSAFVFICYLVQSNQLRVRAVDVHSGVFGKLLNGKVIVQLSDLHIGRDGFNHEARLRERLAELQPDLILLTGDYVSWFGESGDYRKAFNFLATLDAPLGVFAVLGDADYSNERESCGFCHSANPASLTPLNHVRFLRNAYIDVPIGEDTLRIAGMDGGSELKLEIHRLPELTGSRPTILLSHTSLIYDEIPEDRDVFVLSGDTHGGEVAMPSFFWRLLKRKPDPDHIYGPYGDGNKRLYVSSGIANDMPFRFGVPPEVVVLRFQ